MKSNKDTRYGVAAVVSHDGIKLPCVAVSNLAAFRAHVGEAQYKEVNKQSLFYYFNRSISCPTSPGVYLPVVNQVSLPISTNEDLVMDHEWQGCHHLFSGIRCILTVICQE